MTSFGSESTTDDVLDGIDLSGRDQGVRAYALDPNAADALWELFERLVG